MASCVVCGKVRVPNPDGADGWHILETARGLYAVCPQHAPAENATPEQRRKVYIALFKLIFPITEPSSNRK